MLASQRAGFPGAEFRNRFTQIRGGYSCCMGRDFPRASFYDFSPHEATRCDVLRNTGILSQDSEYDTARRAQFNGQWRGWRIARSFEGNRNLPNVWWNGTNRKSNLNWTTNDLNGNDWVPFVRYLLHDGAPLFAGLSRCACFSHPPSIRPISSNFSDSRMYFFASSMCISQPS